jgi:hypothetical protein
VSCLFWTLNKLSKTYIISKVYPVLYENIPANQILLSSPPNELEIKIEGHGFNLLLTQYSSDEDTLKINVSKLPQKIYGEKSFAYSSPDALLYSANDKISRNLNIIKILTDTLFLRFDIAVEKEVPIKSICQFKLDLGYAIKDSVLFSPRMVKIKGPKSIVDSIRFINTDTLKVENLNTNFSANVKLIKNDKRLILNPSSVNFNFKIEKISEKMLNFNIEKYTTTDGEIIPYPSSVDLYFDIPLSRFDDNLLFNGLKVTLDTTHLNSRKLLPVIIKNIPSSVQLKKVSPEKVEYLINSNPK